MVNDCSTDGSDKIIDEYAEKYDCCKAIHLPQNTGAAHGPRNRGLEECTGDYIMFLDPDDRYTPDACEVLYKAVKENDAEVAFGRFRRIFEYGGTVQKSFSPYEDNLEETYPDEVFEDANPLNVSDFVWNNVLEKILYGRKLSKKEGKVDIIKIDSIEEEPDLLKMAPSVWTKICKRSLIMDNDLRFKPFISGDDMAYTLELLLNAKGIVYLNNFMAYDYYIRDLPDDKSITNNVSVKLLKELMESYIYCVRKTESYSKEIAKIAVTPHLLHWMHMWKGSPFTTRENRLLLKKVNELKKIHNRDLKSRLIISSMTTTLETTIHTKKHKNEVKV